MSTEILCIGAAHMDRKAYAMSKIQLYTSIPVCIESSPGGVARNVAENLARLGHSVTLLSRVGKDREGERVIDTLNRIKIQWLESIFSAEHHTASYTALFTPEGELFLALAEMDIYDELDVPFFTTHLETMVRKAVDFGQAAACVTLATTAAVHPEMCHQKLLELTELP